MYLLRIFALGAALLHGYWTQGPAATAAARPTGDGAYNIYALTAGEIRSCAPAVRQSPMFLFGPACLPRVGPVIVLRCGPAGLGTCCPPSGADLGGLPASPRTFLLCPDGKRSARPAVAPRVRVAVGTSQHEAAEKEDDEGEEEESAEGPQDAPAAWIGIQLGPVPEAVGSQLALDRPHLMILNVAVGSPADEAGLQQYDVITHLNDQNAPGDPGKFLELVQSFEIDSRQSMTVVRGGKKKDVSLKIVRRPALDGIRYKFKTEQDDSVQDTLGIRGGLIRRKSGGGWEALPLERWPKDFSLPLPPDAVWLEDPSGGGGSMVVVETKDGDTTEVRRNPDGSFRVTRTSRDRSDARSSTRKFENEQTFKKGDPEAFKVYRRSASGRVFQAPVPGVDARAHADALRRYADQIRRQSLESAQEARRAAQDAGRAVRERLGGWGRDGDRPSVRFDVGEDGRITVTVREDDQELVQRFKNADELKSRRPDLHRKYRQMNRQHQERNKPAADPDADDEGGEGGDE